MRGKSHENRGLFPDFFQRRLNRVASWTMQDRNSCKHPVDGRPDCPNHAGAIALIERAFPPYGWALPGTVDPGESCEEAAVREGQEELSIRVNLEGQLGTYSDPGRDPRMLLSVVFMARPAETEALEVRTMRDVQHGFRKEILECLVL